MKKNIASFVQQNHFAFEEFDQSQIARIDEDLVENELDGEALSGEIAKADQAIVTLESMYFGLTELKQQGKGLSMEAGKFVQIYLSAVNKDFSVNQNSFAFESIGSDSERLEVALENVPNTIIAIFKSKLSGFLFLFSVAFKYFEKGREKAILTNNLLKKAISDYNQSGPIADKEFAPSAFDGLVKQDSGVVNTGVIISNVKEYANASISENGIKALETVIDKGDEIIKMIRKTWFFTSNAEMKGIDKINSEMKESLMNYASKSEKTIGASKYKLEFTEDYTPITTKNEDDRIQLFPVAGPRWAKTMSEAEFKTFSNSLLQISEDDIKAANSYYAILKKTQSIYGWSTINNAFRLGPILAGILASAINPALGAVVSKIVPASRDIHNAMLLTNYMDTLKVYLFHEARARNKILTQGIDIIKRQTT
jgi:hypothetical protein